MADLVIMSIGLLGMMKMQMHAVQENAFGGRMSTAIALAQDQMEALVKRNRSRGNAPARLLLCEVPPSLLLCEVPAPLPLCEVASATTLLC